MYLKPVVVQGSRMFVGGVRCASGIELRVHGSVKKRVVESESMSF